MERFRSKLSLCIAEYFHLNCFLSLVPILHDTYLIIHLKYKHRNLLYLLTSGNLFNPNLNACSFVIMKPAPCNFTPGLLIFSFAFSATAEVSSAPMVKSG